MRLPTHAIDPDGEVIIVLRNANSPFAQAPGITTPGMTLSESSHCFKSPAEVIKISVTYPGKPTNNDPATEAQACELSIQVSAKHLIFASSVFKSILTGAWKESITYMEKGSVEITAESWDFEALLIVLNAIHGKYHQIPQNLTLEMLAKVAVIVDYYDCKETVYIMKDIWIGNLKEKIPTTYSRDLILWLWVSWFFQLPSQFKETTSTVMSCSGNLIDSWGLPISDKVIGLMNKLRQEAIDPWIVRLYETHDALLNGRQGCCFECTSIMYGALATQMRSGMFLWRPVAPFPYLNHRNLIRTILAFKSPGWGSSERRYGASYNIHKCANSSFESLSANLKTSIEGLDLNSLDSL
ncbi:uncharacterized protein N7518_003697 [Penicillium psychrosexuale]|uniref:uncharacterized protein n=1 Tax=Penicillium psychrosexuale TaxID=1002107 RepID=UPI002544DB0E|nr:uncharacterized protein N7518_003697 [Penicillium psychrosexuale]KAJ5801629.1 hypothetical protein N7518_003697 [Penicillium psychrosexuale]